MLKLFKSITPRHHQSSFIILIMQEQHRLQHSSPHDDYTNPTLKEPNSLSPNTKKNVQNIGVNLDISNQQIVSSSKQHRQRFPIIPEATREYIHYQIRNQVQPASSDAQKNQSQIISNSKIEDLQAPRSLKKQSKTFIGCNCQKSRCSKNYCECFTQGRKCNSLCKCMGCENNTQNQNRYRAPMQAEQGERSCNCKRSNCLKKYCECYHNGQRCTKNCKCEECKNTQDDGEERDPQMAEHRQQAKRQRSQQQIEEINNKIDEIARLIPAESQELVLGFLQYWLS